MYEYLEKNLDFRNFCYKNKEFFSEEREFFLYHIDPSRLDKEGMGQYGCKICSTYTYVHEE